VGSKSKNSSIQAKGVGQLGKKVAVLESQLSETEVSVFQVVVRLEALARLLVEKEYISQDEFQEQINKVIDYYRSTALEQNSNTDDLNYSSGELDSGGKLKVEAVSE
jgi:hypothetical protein